MRGDEISAALVPPTGLVASTRGERLRERAVDIHVESYSPDSDWAKGEFREQARLYLAPISRDGLMTRSFTERDSQKRFTKYIVIHDRGRLAMRAGRVKPPPWDWTGRRGL